MGITEKKEMRNGMKGLPLALLASLFMISSLMLMGCSINEPETLEDYVKNNEQIQKSIDEMTSSSSMTVEISGNNLTYTYTYEQTFDEAKIKKIRPQFEEKANELSSTFENIGTTLEEETGIEDVTVKIIYKDGAGTEVYSMTY